MLSRRSILSVLVVFAILAGACGKSDGPDSSETPGAGPNATSATGATPGSDSGTSSSEDRSAEVSEIQKAVEARNTEGEDWGDASEGQVIAVGGGVKTGDEARARLSITDGSILRLSGNTEFRLTELSTEATDPETKLKLDAGKMWVFVTKALGVGTFEIETPSGVATVRGSFISTAYSPTFGHMIVTCLEGQCQFARPGGAVVDLIGGEQSEILGAGRDPSPARPMDEAELEEWEREFPEALDAVRRLREQRGTPPPTPPGGSSAASGLSGQTACDHPYFPLRPGATWTYSTESGATTWTVNSVTGDAASASAEVTVAFAEGTLTWNFQCDASGITSYDFGAVRSNELGQVAAFNVTNRSGVLIPAAELLVPGYSWTYAYELQMDFTAPGQDQPFSGANARTEERVVTGAEPVTVGDQTFDGLLISFKGTSTLQMQVPGVETPPITTSESGAWTVARGVGIVMTTSQSESFSSQSTLTSYHIP